MAESKETTNVKVENGTWRQLNRLKEPGDTFDDVISRLLDNAPDG